VTKFKAAFRGSSLRLGSNGDRAGRKEDLGFWWDYGQVGLGQVGQDTILAQFLKLCSGGSCKRRVLVPPCLGLLVLTVTAWFEIK
jgi:hypothetical protein